MPDTITSAQLREAQIRDAQLLISALTERINQSAQVAGIAASMDPAAITAWASAINSSARAALVQAQTGLSALLVAPQSESQA